MNALDIIEFILLPISFLIVVIQIWKLHTFDFEESDWDWYPTVNDWYKRIIGCYFRNSLYLFLPGVIFTVLDYFDQTYTVTFSIFALLFYVYTTLCGVATLLCLRKKYPKGKLFFNRFLGTQKGIEVSE